MVRPLRYLIADVAFHLPRMYLAKFVLQGMLNTYPGLNVRSRRCRRHRVPRGQSNQRPERRRRSAAAGKDERKMTMSQRDRSSAGGGALSWLALPVLVLTVFAGLSALLPGRRKKPKTKVEEIVERLPHSMDDPRVRKAVEGAQQKFGDVRGRIDVEDAQAFGEEVANRVATLVAASKTGIPPLTRDMSERARHAADWLREEGAERGAEWSERLKTDVAPAAKVWAHEAIEEAEDILTAARERAGNFSETARTDYLPGVSAKAGAMGGVVAGSAAGAAQLIGKRAGKVKSAKLSSPVLPRLGRKQASTAGKPLSAIQRSTHRAGSALQRAGSETKFAVTESIMIMFWASALGAVIYYGLLNDETRERVTKFLAGAMDQLQDVTRDFQADDDELPVSNS